MVLSLGKQKVEGRNPSAEKTSGDLYEKQTEKKEAKMKTKPKHQIKSMRLHLEAIKIVEEMAKEENRNFTNMVETIILRAEAQPANLNCQPKRLI